ncbi:MAG: two-component system response regulator CreB [Deltaproteobacteria bacterium RIFOXYA12_FULL_58_15]|nr:MAG: two-component system response regulator CreB [Deltaproteobacteria bacterium RIFOXYA12_FULL_58_15]
MANVLVVDDDGHIREVVRFALEKSGYAVEEAADGAAALEAFSHRPFDVVVLDIIMPELDGIEVCRRLRQVSRVPILFLSSRDEEIDRILGLEIGADDYLTKPFSPRELTARVKALLRRTMPHEKQPTQTLKRGPLCMDIERHQCFWQTTEILLTVTEFAILRTLLNTPGKVFTRDELVDRAYGHGHVITERTVDSHVRRIRKKISDHGGDPVETVYGMGYRLREEM